jgi:methionyl aminopeptidase
MIVLRSKDEIAKMRQAGSILAHTLEKLKQCAKAGVNTQELDDIARREILNRDGYPAFKGYNGFPGNICVSINEMVVHGIPSNRKLREADIVSIDVGVRFRGYNADGAITVGIGNISEEAKRLIEITEKALYIGIDLARPGRHLSDVSCAIQAFVESNGFSVVRALVGHGIGTKIHEEPEVPNFGKPGMGPILEPGMVLAIEPMVNAGGFEVETLEDGWSVVTKDRKLSAHFEHTVAVMEDGPEILTLKNRVC